MNQGAFKATILLVEDDEMVRNLTCKVLEMGGFDVLEAFDGREALDLLERTSKNVDLVVTDIVMPRMNGAELARELSRTYPHLRILFISGYTDLDVVKSQQDSFEYRFLHKPFLPSTLLSTVSELLQD